MSGRRRKAGGRKQLFNYLLGVLLWVVLAACSNGGEEDASEKHVSIDHPLDGRLNCIQRESSSSCQFLVQVMAADADINPDFQATMLQAAEFEGSTDPLDAQTQNGHNLIRADLPTLPHQEWREIPIQLEDDADLVHSGCYIIQLDAQDTSLPEKYKDKIQLFVYNENGRPIYFHNEQQFLNRLGASFQDGKDSQVAYDFIISPEDPTRGELLIKVTGNGTQVTNQSNLQVYLDSGIIFEDTENLTYRSVSNQHITSDIGPILPDGYRVVVIPLRLDLNSYPGGRTIEAVFDIDASNGTVDDRIVEIAPIGIGWVSTEDGRGKLIEESRISSVIQTPGFTPVSTGALIAGTNQFNQTNVGVGGGGSGAGCPEGTQPRPFEINILSGPAINYYRGLQSSGTIGNMTPEIFLSLFLRYNSSFENEVGLSLNNLNFNRGQTYFLPQCVLE